MGFAAIVLAAGAGRRFGGGKMIAPYKGRPLVTWAIETANRAPVDEIIIVLGAEAQDVGRVVTNCTVSKPLRTVVATDWFVGVSASLRAGGDALHPETKGAFVLLGDMPSIPPTVLSPLAAAVRSGAPAAVPIFEGSKGHPVLLGRTLLDRLHELDGDHGARSLLASVERDLAQIPSADPGILFDVDYASALGRENDRPN